MTTSDAIKAIEAGETVTLTAQEAIDLINHKERVAATLAVNNFRMNVQTELNDERAREIALADDETSTAFQNAVAASLSFIAQMEAIANGTS